METVLALALLSILFLEYGKKLQSQIWSVVQSNPIGLVKYLGASSVFALTLALLPKVLIVLYMRDKGFWAYEIFGAQSGSFGVIALNVFLNLVLLTLGTFAAALVIALRGGPGPICLSVALNLFIVAIFLYMAAKSGDWLLAISVLVFCLVLAVYAAIWVKLDIDSKARYWFFPLCASVLVALLLAIWPASGSKLAMAGLRQMKLGGFPVRLYEPYDVLKREHPTNAYLLLRTPEFLYLSQKEGDSRVYIASSDHLIVDYPTSFGSGNVPGSHDEHAP